MKFKLSILILIILLIPSSIATSYYIDSADGDDDNNGNDQAIAWKTTINLMDRTFTGGDKIFFKRGLDYRTSLYYIEMGNNGLFQFPITISAYGTGSNPRLIGSVEKSQASDWTAEYINIWKTGGFPVGNGTNLVINGDFDSGIDGWYTYFDGNGSGTYGLYGSDCMYGKCLVINISYSGIYSNKVQVYQQSSNQLDIERGEMYVLSFYAKTNETFTLRDDSIKLMDPTYTPLTYEIWNDTGVVFDGAWKKYNFFMLVNNDTQNASLRFYIGGSVANSSQIIIDNLTFEKADNQNLLQVDVGNIIFNDETSVGNKSWNWNNLTHQGDFWYNEDSWEVYFYSTTNPGTFYSNMELVLKNDGITLNKDNYIIENLTIMNYGELGIAMGESDNIRIANNKFSFIGGSKQYDEIRFGNAVQLWCEGSNILVEDNIISQTYDAALTTQCNTGNQDVSNLTFRNNILYNNHYSFEFFHRYSTSDIDDIIFENNTCINAGYGLLEPTRPDKGGRHLKFFNINATVTNLKIRNNIFYESTHSALDIGPYWTGINESLTLENNLYYESLGNIVNWNGTTYNMTAFDTYQSNHEKDGNSTAQEIYFRDPAINDYAPGYTAIACNMSYDGNTYIGALACFGSDPGLRDHTVRFVEGWGIAIFCLGVAMVIAFAGIKKD